MAASRLRAAADAARPAEHSGAVVAAAADPAATAAHRFPADQTTIRHRAEGGDAAAYAMVADALAADARHAGDHRCRGSLMESARGDNHLQGAACPAHR